VQEEVSQKIAKHVDKEALAEIDEELELFRNLDKFLNEIKILWYLWAIKFPCDRTT
jgi:hypothetical protein